jgi:predicted Co/Zn/Cd cation transporter (cation efflux family)
MTLRGYRPDLPSQRRLLFASVVAVAFGGVAALVTGLVNHSAYAIAAGVFGLAAATFGFSSSDTATLLASSCRMV